MVVKVGSIVENLSGDYTGIVLKLSKEYPGQFYVRYWDEQFNLYIHYYMHKNLLRPAIDPARANRINRKDPEFQRILKTELVDLALATNDPEWFDQLMKGGMKNETENI